MGRIIKGFFYFIPIFYNEENNELKGKNAFFDLLLNIMIFIHKNIVIKITGIEDFPIKLEVSEWEE
ncbi:MAG: hypothetical protein PHS93_07985 [Candidatus Omnitrophica bacterium]|nr:hypothetical protein [Candidatus Omnitrophota bacterium]